MDDEVTLANSTSGVGHLPLDLPAVADQLLLHKPGDQALLGQFLACLPNRPLSEFKLDVDQSVFNLTAKSAAFPIDFSDGVYHALQGLMDLCNCHLVTILPSWVAFAVLEVRGLSVESGR